MKKTIVSTLFLLLISILLHAQKAPKVIKEEILKDSHSDRKNTYMVTFKDGVKDKICEKVDGTWWVLIPLTKPDGPYQTKQEALDRAYSRTKGAKDTGGKVGGTIAGALIKDKKTYVDEKGKKYYMENGKRIYVK